MTGIKPPFFAGIDLGHAPDRSTIVIARHLEDGRIEILDSYCSETARTEERLMSEWRRTYRGRKLHSEFIKQERKQQMILEEDKLLVAPRTVQEMAIDKFNEAADELRELLMKDSQPIKAAISTWKNRVPSKEHIKRTKETDASSLSLTYSAWVVLKDVKSCYDRTCSDIDQMKRSLSFITSPLADGALKTLNRTPLPETRGKDFEG